MTDKFLNGTSLFRKRRRVTDNVPAPPSVYRAPPQPSTDDISSVKEASSETSSRPTTAIRSDDQSDTSFSPPKKNHHRRDSSLTSFSELKSSIRRRSASLRSKTPTNLQDKLAQTGPHYERRNVSRPHLNLSALSSQQSYDSLASTSTYAAPATAIDGKSSRTHHFQQMWNGGSQADDGNLRPATALGAPYSAAPRSASAAHTGSGSNASDSRNVLKKVRKTADDRITLLRYLCQIYKTKTHWFNTYRFSSSQIHSLPSMHPIRLARRTHSLFLLGLSIPFALDPNSDSLTEYLRTLSALMSEYESYTTLHPAEGASHSGFPRARIPQMFKRGVSGASKGRRGSSADILLNSPPDDPRSASSGGLSSGGLTPGSATWASFPNMTQEADLMPGEDYQLLLTPALPFDCDYLETFTTVCDVLSDVYRNLVSLISEQFNKTGQGSAVEGGPSLSVIAESFAKVDSKIKKLVMVGLVREFEEASKQGIRSEIAGVGKLTLGGLI